MIKQYFFISGLPRSGSTLLSSILRQNPDFHADIASPLVVLVKSTIDTLTGCENNFDIKEDKRKIILEHLFNGYYSHINKPVIFDSARRWTASTGLLKELFSYTKIICCVREINWILDSFERIAAKNCFYTNTLVADEARETVENRCDCFMDPTRSGVVIKPWFFLQEGLALNPDMIHLVEYEQLCKKPKETMQSIYKFINKPYFNHDFDNVEFKNENFDKFLNMKDLHTVKKKVEWIEKKFILPKSVLEKFDNLDFWKNIVVKYE